MSPARFRSAVPRPPVHPAYARPKAAPRPPPSADWRHRRSASHPPWPATVPPHRAAPAPTAALSPQPRSTPTAETRSTVSEPSPANRFRQTPSRHRPRRQWSRPHLALPRPIRSRSSRSGHRCGHRCPDQSACRRVRSWVRPNRQTGSDKADADDLIAALAAGGFHLDRVALVLADQRTRQGRTDVQHPVFDIGFGFADDLIGQFLVGILVHQNYRRPEFDRAGKLGRINHLGQRNQRLKLFDAAFDEALLFAGGMIFGVFRQIAMLTRLGNGADHGGALHPFQYFKFFVQRAEARPRHRTLFPLTHHANATATARGAP